ncbi:hypothetical protein C8R43DRAFT_1117915 [Mycena crocata]|nr:hypothetical protein C8R43DRAFT_1117915 [Mycena crocata]
MHAYYSATCPIFAPYLFPLRLSSSCVLIRARVLEAGWREHSHANFFVPTRTLSHIPSRPDRPDVNLFVASHEILHANFPPDPLAHSFANLFVQRSLTCLDAIFFQAASPSTLARIPLRTHSCTRHFILFYFRRRHGVNLFVPSRKFLHTTSPSTLARIYSTLARIPSRQPICALAIILFYFRRRPGVNFFVPSREFLHATSPAPLRKFIRAALPHVPWREFLHATSPSTLAHIPSRQPIRALLPLFHLVNHSALFTTDYSFQGPPLPFQCLFLRLELQALAVLAKNRSYKYALCLQYYFRTR